MVYAINVKICILVTWLKRARALGCFYGALVSLPKDLSVSGFPRDLQYNHECYMALALVKYMDLFYLSSLPKGARGAPIYMFSSCQEGALWFLCIFVSHPLEGSSCLLMGKPSRLHLLDEPLKDFIVIPVCSPWKCFGSN